MAPLIDPNEHNTSLIAKHCDLTGDYSDSEDESFSLSSEEDEEDVEPFILSLAVKPMAVDDVCSDSPNPTANTDLHEACKIVAAKLGIKSFPRPPRLATREKGFLRPNPLTDSYC